LPSCVTTAKRSYRYRLEGRSSSTEPAGAASLAPRPDTLGALDAGPAEGSTYGFMLRWLGKRTGVSTFEDVELCAKRYC